jgi:histidyl-tRNA synthetase
MTQIMQENKRETFKIKRESYIVPQQLKDQLKTYNSVKKSIIVALGEEELNIPQIAEKINMNTTDTLYYVMSLLKFNIIQTARLDDMDEFYLYKIKR